MSSWFYGSAILLGLFEQLLRFVHIWLDGLQLPHSELSGLLLTVGLYWLSAWGDRAGWAMFLHEASLSVSTAREVKFNVEVYSKSVSICFLFYPIG